MRLLYRADDGKLKITRDLIEKSIPKYAILSHTWSPNDNDEVTFRDMDEGNVESKPAGMAKIRFCEGQAAKDKLKYFWVYTCCINKESSAELQEAITSMFAWYRGATKCYVYLPDVQTDERHVDATGEQPHLKLWEPDFRRSRWFTRGWTLQELLAPRSVEFFSADWIRLGDRESLERCIQDITGIPRRALRGDALNFSTAERLAWTENRNTKRREDKSYSLLGIFSVFMPLIYGEGDYAWTRLLVEIDKKHAETAELDNILSNLPIATEAPFNSLRNQHEPVCL
jgi:hypothetical protein